MPDPLMQELALHEYLRTRIVECYPEVDEETLADTLEGLTSLMEKLSAIVRSQQDDNAFSKALRIRIEEMRERLKRLEIRVDKKRDLVATVMERAGIKKLNEPDFTASLRSTPRPLVVSDEEEIPGTYWRAQPPKLDRKKLTDDLKNGNAIPGACLGNGGQTISVRVK